jgi:peroxiredoxin
MSLQEMLRATESEHRSKRDPAIQAIYDRSVRELADSRINQTSLKVGDTIPLFSLPNAHERETAISDILSNGPAIISFYRGGWCPYCNLELRALQQVLPQIRAAGGSLVAISPERPDRAEDTATRNSLTFEVLSDHDNKVARQFGILFPWPDDLRDAVRANGRDIAEINGVERTETPIPATYVVGADRKIVYAFVDADYTKRAEPLEILAALKRITAA